MKLLYFIFPVLVLGSCSKKQDVSIQPESENEIIELPDMPERDNENTIGFACGFSGTSSDAVASISYLAENKKYETLKSALYKGTPAKRYLASLVCKRLEENKKLSLNPGERLQLNQNINSEEQVHTCSGCTYFEQQSLKTLNSDEFFNREIDEWLNALL